MSTGDRGRGLVCVLLGAVVALGPAPARADGAAERFQEGLRLFRDGAWAEARANFEAAYAIQPNFRVLANVADCWAHEGKPVEAVQSYRRFLLEGAAQVEPASRRRVDAEIARLRARIGDIVLAVEPQGAEVRLDGVVVGTTPLPSSVAVEPGARTLEVRAAGHIPLSRVVQVAAGQEASLSIVLQRIEARAPNDGTPSADGEDGTNADLRGPLAPRAPGERSYGLVWAGAGVTAALAVGGAITGVLAVRAHDEYEDPSTTLARRQALYDGKDTLHFATEALLGGALVLGAATLLWALAGPTGDDGEQQSSARPRTAMLCRGTGGVACDLSLSF